MKLREQISAKQLLTTEPWSWDLDPGLCDPRVHKLSP